MLTRDSKAVHLLAVVVLMLWGSRVTADPDPCGPAEGSEQCIIEPTNATQTVHPENGNDVSSGSCDFSDGMCDYSAGQCLQQEKDAKWTHYSSAGGFLEAAFSSGRNGSNAKSPVLESPLLDIRAPSCLTLTLSTAGSSQLGVYLGSQDSYCNLAVKNTTSVDTLDTFRLELPENVSKVTFQGFGSGNGTTNHVVRLHSALIHSECCIDGEPRDHPQATLCQWDMRGWSNQTGNGFAASDGNVSMLTSPVMDAIYPGRHVDCLNFEFFLQETKEVSLSVSLLVGPHGQEEVLKWRVYENGSKTSGRVIYKFGQLPMSLTQAFRIRFTVRPWAGQAVVFVRGVKFTRGQTTPCPVLPPDAAITEADADTNIAVIAGVLSAVAVVIVVVVSLNISFLWARRQRKRNVTQSEVPVQVDVTGRPYSTHIYMEVI